ncbi:MAG: hypothetical protein GEU88_07170 [Solirubrobacterales bacterium]|nr:hypothetical protein [Solirubrobacterales bacterium]
MSGAVGDEAEIARVVARVRELLRDYRPPSFDHVPDPDAALFLCAVDHRTGYEAGHLVAGEGPFAGSELMWAVALRAARGRRGLLGAGGLAGVTAEEVADLFRIDDETVADPGRRAELWRDLAAGLDRDHDGEARRLLAAAGARLGGGGGLVALLAYYRAYADPLAKKSQLFGKICERRGWFEVADPECWEVSADNVLMRLGLRSGLVASGDLDRVRADTRAAFKRVAAAAGVTPPLLDDLLWELGRHDPDLLGRQAGDLREPPRERGVHWY